MHSNIYFLETGEKKQNACVNIYLEKMVLISKIFYVILDVDIYLDNKVTRFYLKLIGTEAP